MRLAILQQQRHIQQLTCQSVKQIYAISSRTQNLIKNSYRKVLESEKFFCDAIWKVLYASL